MFGKHYASMYTGSMFGKPALVFAVLGYVISNMRPSRRDGECFVEINPMLLAATFATSLDEVDAALLDLESPDPASRNKRDGGRRIVLLDDERLPGPRQYRVVNGSMYRAIRDEDERREQNRQSKRRQRARQPMSANVSQRQPKSAQAEGEAEAEAEAKNERVSRRRASSRARTTIPADWQPTEKHRELAKERELNVTTEVEKFMAHANAHGRELADWNAGFSQWLLQAHDFKRGGAALERSAPKASRADKYRNIRPSNADGDENYEDSPSFSDSAISAQGALS